MFNNDLSLNLFQQSNCYHGITPTRPKQNTIFAKNFHTLRDKNGPPQKSGAGSSIYS